MSNRSWFIGAAVLLMHTLAACGSATPSPSQVRPQTVSVQGEGTVNLTRDAYADTDRVDEPLDEVWDALGTVFQALEIPVTHREPDAHVMGNLSFSTRQLGGERMSRWLYCGRNVTTGRPHADTYDVRIDVRTVLTAMEGEDGGTGITTWVGGNARSRGASGDPVNCTTTGDLEVRILELLELELARRAVARG
jgi:hypothetical protein